MLYVNASEKHFNFSKTDKEPGRKGRIRCRGKDIRGRGINLMARMNERESGSRKSVEKPRWTWDEIKGKSTAANAGNYELDAVGEKVLSALELKCRWMPNASQK